MYKLEFSNGYVIDEAEGKGGFYLVAGELNRSDIEGGLSRVIVTRTSTGDPDEEDFMEPGTYEHQRIATCCAANFQPGYTMLELRGMTENELREMRIMSKVEYLAMMTDIEL